jgi:hypothetical protein
MPALDGFDTGYRSPDWHEREAWQQRLDYHDGTVCITALEMKDEMWRGVRFMMEEDGPEHVRDHVRNTLALLLRNVCGECRMSPEQMKAFICGPADQAYREDRIRIFHGGAARPA